MFETLRKDSLQVFERSFNMNHDFVEIVWAYRRYIGEDQGHKEELQRLMKKSLKK